MAVLSGTISGSIGSAGYTNPCTIKSWSLVNNTGGALAASLAIANEGEPPIYIFSGSIAAAGSTSSDVPVKVNRRAQIIVITAGAIDYYISID